MPNRSPEPLRALLTGGDRRSIANSRTAHALVLADPSRVSELAALTDDEDWLVRLRAADLLEKFAHSHPEWVAPHKRVFIGPLADSEQWEIRLQVVRALPLFAWTPAERRRALDILQRDLDHSQTFVKAWALDSFATLADGDPKLLTIVRRYLRRFARSGRKALAARARHIATRLSRRG
jgi:hypothetical protein